MPKAPHKLDSFSSLLQVVEALRGPDGCPWDKEQTHNTLTRYAIEEAHELVEAIENGEQNHLVEELGDLLLQVVLHAEIARQDNRFSIADVLLSINSKMIRRHPHVFGESDAQSSAEVLERWEEIKKAEKEQKAQKMSVFDIPVHLPALERSQKIGQKTKHQKFDWKGANEVVSVVRGEMDELDEALNQQNKDEIEHEIGDCLFSIVQLARHVKVNAEQALRKANRRFEDRFLKMKEICESQNRQWDSLSDEEKEALWQEAKKALKKT